MIAAQPHLHLADSRFRPTLGMDGAKHLLDKSEDEILALIEEGLLSHAWNIGLGRVQREIRILRNSLDATLAWLANPRAGYLGRPDTRSLDSDHVLFAQLLPPGHTQPFLTNGQVQRSLNCISDHVINLVAAGELLLQPGTKYTRGPHGAALITVASFKAFLTSRRL